MTKFVLSVAIIAVSMVAMATIYVMDYYKRQEESNNNSTRLIVIEPEIVTTRSPLITKDTSSTNKPIEISPELNIIGVLDGCTESEDKCQSFCCALENNSNEIQVANDLSETQSNFINEVPVFIVEPEIVKSTSTIRTTLTSTVKSSTRATSITSTSRSSSTTSPTRSSSTATDVKKLMELLSSEDPEIEKHNQVLDDVNKANLDIKEEKVDVKICVIG